MCVYGPLFFGLSVVVCVLVCLGYGFGTVWGWSCGAGVTWAVFRHPLVLKVSNVCLWSSVFVVSLRWSVFWSVLGMFLVMFGDDFVAGSSALRVGGVSWCAWGLKG